MYSMLKGLSNTSANKREGVDVSIVLCNTREYDGNKNKQTINKTTNINYAMCRITGTNVLVVGVTVLCVTCCSFVVNDSISPWRSLMMYKLSNINWLKMPYQVEVVW